MCLLLDIDDIDRVWHAAGWQRDDEHLLRQRRYLAFCCTVAMRGGSKGQSAAVEAMKSDINTGYRKYPRNSTECC